jgi:spermidine synthase
VVIADGLKYVADTEERFDAIIVDSSEPIGPSAVLHTREFFTDCKRALKPGGVLITQNGLPFLFPEHLAQTSEIFASLFKSTSPFLCTQPCYFGGPFALNWASDDKELLAVPEATLARRMGKRGITARYYTPAVHHAAFALPGYVAAAIRSQAAPKAQDKARGTRKR